MLCATLFLIASLATAQEHSIDFAKFHRLEALEEPGFAINIRSDMLPLIASDDGRLLFARWKPGIFGYATGTGRQVFAEKVYIVHRGKKPMIAATDSQFAHLEGYKFLLLSGTIIAAPSASQSYCFFPVTNKPNSVPGAEEFYLASVYPNQRGQHPNAEVRAPGKLRRPAIVVSRLAVFTSNGKLFITANASNDKNRLDMRVMSWDGKGSRLRLEPGQPLSGYSGRLELGGFRLFNMDIPAGKLLYLNADAGKIREYDARSRKFVEAVLPYKLRQNPTGLYYRGHLLVWDSNTRQLWELDRVRGAWSAIGPYEVVGTSAAQNWLIVRTAGGHVLIGG
jgi:hypothetical protein